MRILVIDDSLKWIEEARSIFAKLGHETAANIGPRGAAFAARVSAPDVVLLDLNMPDLDGKWLLREIKQTGARVFFCSDAEPGTLRRLARLVGADGAIAKSEVRAASADLRRILEGKS